MWFLENLIILFIFHISDYNMSQWANILPTLLHLFTSRRYNKHQLHTHTTTDYITCYQHHTTHLIFHIILLHFPFWTQTILLFSSFLSFCWCCCCCFCFAVVDVYCCRWQMIVNILLLCCCNYCCRWCWDLVLFFCISSESSVRLYSVFVAVVLLKL